MSHLHDVAIRFWDELVLRSKGPLAFRFMLQPAMASLLAVRDGLKDAQDGRRPYLWTILHDPVARPDRLDEGLHAVARVMILGAGMDALYQITVIRGLRPLELVDIVILLAFIFYLIVRGPADRIAAWWQGRTGSIGGARSRTG